MKVGSRKRVGEKYKGDICAYFLLKLWFEEHWYFCNIKSQHGFESYCPVTEFDTIQLTITWSKSTIETLERDLKYVQS